MATIHVIQGPDKGWMYDLHAAETIVGRTSDGLQLNDVTVSRSHARLLPDAGEWILEDLGSANGTYLNGVRLGRGQQLRQGDQIRVGASLLVFGGAGSGPQPMGGGIHLDDDGRLVESAIITSIPSNEDSVIMPTPEAGDQAIGNLRHLYQLIGTISTIFDVELLLNRVLDNVCELLRPDRAYVLMLDDDGGMTPLAARYDDPDARHEVPLSRTIVNHVVTNHVGVLCSNAMGDKRFTKGHSVHDFNIRSALCVPIMGRDRILGVLHVDTSVSNVTYSTEQLRLLTAIGYQTGLAVENVRLYETAVKTERLAAVGEAVATLSHSIKNILQALQAGTDVAAMALERGNPDQARQAWPIVTRNLDRINTLILNMLAFSKPRRPLLRAININTLLTECIELITPMANDRGITVTPTLGDLPPIPADVEGLHQAFMNLLTNAMDAAPKETGELIVASDFDPIHQKATVSITDNGPGVNSEAKAKLFEPFFSTKGQKGTGLGLAVTQKVAHEHGGRIDYTSEPGAGTTFTLVLPADSDIGSQPDMTHGPA